MAIALSWEHGGMAELKRVTMELQRKIKPNIDRNFLANEADPGLCNTNTMILVSDIDVAESWRISNRRCSTCHGSHRWRRSRPPLWLVERAADQ